MPLRVNGKQYFLHDIFGLALPPAQAGKLPFCPASQSSGASAVKIHDRLSRYQRVRVPTDFEGGYREAVHLVYQTLPALGAGLNNLSSGKFGIGEIKAKG